MKKEPKSFVVQLDPDAATGPDGPTPIVGIAESLDTGRVVRFGSGRGLLRFLRSALFDDRTAPGGDEKYPAGSLQEGSEIRRRSDDEDNHDD